MFKKLFSLMLLVFFALCTNVNAIMYPVDMRIESIEFRTSLTDSEITMTFPGKTDITEIEPGDIFHEVGVAVAHELYDANGIRVWSTDDPNTTQTTLVGWTATGVVTKYDPTLDYYELSYLSDPVEAKVILQDYDFGNTVFLSDNSGGTVVAPLFEAHIISGNSKIIIDKNTGGIFINRSILTQVDAVNTSLLTCVEYDINYLLNNHALFEISTDSYTSGITNTKIESWDENGTTVTGLVLGARGVNTTTFKTVIPEPETIMLIGVGLLSIGYIFRRK